MINFNDKLGALVIAIFAIGAILVTVRIYRKNRFSTRLFFMWLFIWLIVGFLALFPSVLDKLMALANMGNRMFFITSAAILFLFILIFYLSANVSKMNRRISKLVQNIAILDYKLEKIQKKKDETITVGENSDQHQKQETENQGGDGDS